MKVAGARGITRSRIPLIAMLALAATIGLAGCEGDNGDDATGPSGPTGPVGPTGPTGPTVPPVVGIEDGGPVTIGNGSTLTAAQIAAIGRIVATIDSASIPAGAPVPVIEFTLKTSRGGAVNGLAPGALAVMVAKLAPPPAGSRAPQSWQSYVNRVQTATAAGAPKPLPSAIQANSETGTTGTLLELGNGKYRYTYKVNLATVTTPIAVSFVPSLTHRVGLELRLSGSAAGLAPDNPFKDVVPNGSAGNGSKLIAATKNCNDCHERLELHGGPRTSVEYCVTCHNPGSVDPDGGESVDMAYMAHSIHAGVERRDFTQPPTFPPLPYVVYGFGGTRHDYGEVTYPQSLLFCETCHVKSASQPDGDAWATNASASSCGGCHAYGLEKLSYSSTTGQYTFAYQHTSFDFLAPDGICTDCHRANGVAGSTADRHLNTYGTGQPGARKLGDQFRFAVLAVTNVGQGKAPLIRFKVSKPDGTPYDIVTDRAFTTSGASLNINVAWDAATDVSNATADGSLPGLRSGSTPRRSGYTLQMNIAQIRAAAAAPGAKGADGSYTIPFFTPVPVATTNLIVQMDGHPRALPPGITDWASSVNAPAFATTFYTGTPRPRLVTQAACENCHQFLSFHGANRNGDPQACTVCHNSSGGYADEGLGPIAMGAMIHNIHAGKVQVGDHAVTYPQGLGNCEACHVAGTYYAARPGAVGISTGSGTDLFNLKDDTWDSATAGTCGTCHDSGPARAHMQQNGGLFGVVGNKTLAPSASTEACVICHGPGRPQDTAKAHAE